MRTIVGFLFSLILLFSASTLFATSSSQDYLDAGDQFYQQKDFNKALLDYKAAVQTDSQNWKAYQALGNCEYSMGKRENAINDFQTSLNINPKNTSLQNYVNQLSQTGPLPTHLSASLPVPGEVVWNIGLAADLYGWQDLTDDYAPATFGAPPGSPIGAEFDFGTDFTLSSNFQLGVQFQTIIKESESVAFSSGTTQIFSETCLGGVLTAQYYFPLGSKINLILHGEGGYYGLVGASLNNTTSSTIQNGSLYGSNFGALLALELELVQNSGWALDIGGGYRLLTMTSVKYANSSSAGSTTLGGKDYLDFSGPRVNITLRLL